MCSRAQAQNFFLRDLCDTYIEWSKTRLYDADGAAVDTLGASLDGALRLLHPFMPYVSEELWQRLVRGGENGVVDTAADAGADGLPASISMAPLPTVASTSVVRDDAAENDMSQLMAVIDAARSMHRMAVDITGDFGGDAFGGWCLRVTASDVTDKYSQALIESHTAEVGRLSRIQHVRTQPAADDMRTLIRTVGGYIGTCEVAQKSWRVLGKSFGVISLCSNGNASSWEASCTANSILIHIWFALDWFMSPQSPWSCH